jgi:hypothetical protein
MWTPKACRRWIPLGSLAFVGLFWAACQLRLAAQPGGDATPDVIVGDIYQLRTWGSLSNQTAFSIGTISCNIGTARLDWIASTPVHPVIAQNLYRVRDGRIEQLGMSWLKHGFVVAAGSTCGNCLDPNPNYLGVNCSDPYSAGLNGNWGRLGPRSEVNASSGDFTFPFTELPTPRTVLDGRIIVANDDLRPQLNPGARYFAEGHYIHPQDAQAGRGNNNASYREVFVAEEPTGELSLTLVASSPVVRTESAIRAWKFVHPDVAIHTIDVPGDGQILVGIRTTPAGVGSMRTDVAVQNLNSHRSVRSVKVNFLEGAVTDSTFRDVDYQHEPYSGTDWLASISGVSIEWSTEDFAVNENANAIRWSTLYAFGCKAPSAPVSIDVGLFRPGDQSSIHVPLEGSPFVGGVPELASDLAVQEDAVNVGSISDDKPATFTVDTRPGSDVSEVTAESSSDQVGVALQTRDVAIQPPGWDIVVTPKAAAASGYFESVITISGKEAQAPIQVRVFGSIDEE